MMSIGPMTTSPVLKPQNLSRLNWLKALSIGLVKISQRSGSCLGVKVVVFVTLCDRLEQLQRSRSGSIWFTTEIKGLEGFQEELRLILVSF